MDGEGGSVGIRGLNFRKGILKCSVDFQLGGFV